MTLLNNILDSVFLNKNNLEDDVIVLPSFLHSDRNFIVISMRSVLVRKTVLVKRVFGFWAGNHKMIGAVFASMNGITFLKKLNSLED